MWAIHSEAPGHEGLGTLLGDCIHWSANLESGAICSFHESQMPTGVAGTQLALNRCLWGDGNTVEDSKVQGAEGEGMGWAAGHGVHRGG